MPDRQHSPLLSDALIQETLRALFYESGDAISLMDTSGRFLDANLTVVAQLGYDRDELRTMGFARTLGTDALAFVEKQFQRAVRGETVRYLATGLRRDGTTFRADVINTPLRANGEVVAVLVIAHDIDELESAQCDREALTALFESTLNEISDGIYFLDKDFCFTFVNPRGEELAQSSRDELIGESLWTKYPLMLGSEFGIAYRKALAEQVKVVVRERYEPFGVTLESTVYPTATGLAIYTRDVTIEQQSRQSLADKEQRIAAQAALLDSARDAIIVLGLDHAIQYWNRAATDIYRWSAEEVQGRSIRELLYSSPEKFDAATAATLARGEWAGDIEQIARDGRVIVADCRWSLVRNADGLPEAIFAVNTDVTIRREQEARALRAQRMESLGTIAGGIAHDLNNVLTPLLMSVQLLADDETDTAKRATLAVIETSAKRGADMMRQILEYAEGVEGSRINVDVTQLARETEAFCTEALPSTIAVTIDVASDCWNVVGDPTQLGRVLVNLVTNAQAAMPGGGLLRISAENLFVSDPLALRLPALGRFVRIQVEDTGSGMTPQVLDRAFEPFFTTKGVGEGSGLGLASSASIVQNHGGSIQAHSEVGAGTRFEILIPAVASEPGVSAQTSIPTATTPRGSGQLVLVVDDESAIRHSARITLESYGYRAAVVANGAEALDYLERFPSQTSLIVSDISMPVMGGVALLAELDRNIPNLPVLLTSGLSFAAPDVQGRREFLAKPFTADQLRSAVARLLDL